MLPWRETAPCAASPSFELHNPWSRIRSWLVRRFSRTRHSSVCICGHTHSCELASGQNPSPADSGVVASQTEALKEKTPSRSAAIATVLGLLVLAMPRISGHKFPKVSNHAVTGLLLLYGSQKMRRFPLAVSEGHTSQNNSITVGSFIEGNRRSENISVLDGTYHIKFPVSIPEFFNFFFGDRMSFALWSNSTARRSYRNAFNCGIVRCVVLCVVPCLKRWPDLVFRWRSSHLDGWRFPYVAQVNGCAIGTRSIGILVDDAEGLIWITEAASWRGRQIWSLFNPKLSLGIGEGVGSSFSRTLGGPCRLNGANGGNLRSSINTAGDPGIPTNHHQGYDSYYPSDDVRSPISPRLNKNWRVWVCAGINILALIIGMSGFWFVKSAFRTEHIGVLGCCKVLLAALLVLCVVPLTHVALDLLYFGQVHWEHLF
jgi:hypothetical protein